MTVNQFLFFIAGLIVILLISAALGTLGAYLVECVRRKKQAKRFAKMEAEMVEQERWVADFIKSGQEKMLK